MKNFFVFMLLPTVKGGYFLRMTNQTNKPKLKLESKSLLSRILMGCLVSQGFLGQLARTTSCVLFESLGLEL